MAKRAGPEEASQEAESHGNRPWAGYDHATIGEILTRASTLNDAGRKRVIDYERHNQKRDDLISVLVNWNS